MKKGAVGYLADGGDGPTAVGLISMLAGSCIVEQRCCSLPKYEGWKK